MSDPCKFYVYVYLDPRKPGNYIYPNVPYEFTHEPFYVGKGTGSRFKAHLRDKTGGNPHKERKINQIKEEKLEIPIIKTFFSDSSDEAFQEEIKLIAAIGMSHKGTGPLTNCLPGGEGGIELSPDTKRKISISLKGRPLSETHKATLKAYWADHPGIMKGRKGPLHPCYGRVGELNPQFGNYGALSATFGRVRPEDELERMRYNKLTSYLIVLDTFSNNTFKVYNVSEFERLHGLPRSLSLLGTLTGEKATHYYGLKIIEKVPLPDRWFDSEELLAEYYKSLEYIIPGLANRDTKELHKKYMKMSAINNHYTIKKDGHTCKVYDITSFCKKNNLDRATLYRTLPGYTRYQKHHHGYTIVENEPLPKGWFRDPTLLKEFDEEAEGYKQAA